MVMNTEAKQHGFISDIDSEYMAYENQPQRDCIFMFVAARGSIY